jgi:predicted transcriptional regulator
MDGKSVTISVRMPHDLRDKLQALAEQRDRTLSQLCMLILRDYIADQEQER